MARTVDYLPFAINVGSNVEGQSSYVIEPIRLTGHQAGVAKSAVMNKTLRQSSVMTAALANLLSEALDVDVLDDGDVEALTALLQDVVMGGRVAILTAPTTFYVRTNGSDNNDGLTPSTAWATPQHAWDEIFYRHNLNGQYVGVDIGNGTFPEIMIYGEAVGGGYLDVYGAGMGSTTLSAADGKAVYLDNGAKALVRDMKLQSAGMSFSAGCNLFLYNNSMVDVRNINFGRTEVANGGTHMVCGIGSIIYGGQWNVNNTYTISGDASNFVNCGKGSTIGFANVVITLVGTPHFSFANITTSIQSNVTFANTVGQTPCAWSGGATGVRFYVDGTSSIFTGTGDVNWIPGSVAGSWVNNNVQGNYG